MVIGILQAELFIGDSGSLKDKRRVLSSLKDKLHRDYQVSVAEVDRQEAHQVAVLGIATVSNEAAHAQGRLDRLVYQLRNDRRIVLTDHSTEILTGY